MLLRHGAEYRLPYPEVARRAGPAHQRGALADLNIGHVISVDVKGLHGRLGGVEEGRGAKQAIIPRKSSHAHYCRSGMRPLAQAQNRYSRSWLWILRLARCTRAPE